MFYLYRTLLLAAMIFHATCYPNGLSVDSACLNLIPGHGVSSQTSAAPYTVTFNPTSFTPGQTIAVTLSSSSLGFRGFMILARRADSNQNQEPLGSFSGGFSTRQACSGKALVHSSSTVKSSLTFNWIAPSFSVRNVTFRVTFVQSLRVFWANRESSVLVEASPTTTTATTSTTLYPHTTTTLYPHTTTTLYPHTTTTLYPHTTTTPYPYATTTTYPSTTATLIKDSTTSSENEIQPSCARFCRDGFDSNNYCLSCCWGMVVERYRNFLPKNSLNSRYFRSRQIFLNDQVKQCMREFMNPPLTR